MTAYITLASGKTLEKGDIVLCPNGHKIAFVREDIKHGQLFWAEKIQFFGKQVAIGTTRENCNCPKCGANWFGDGWD